MRLTELAAAPGRALLARALFRFSRTMLSVQHGAIVGGGGSGLQRQEEGPGPTVPRAPMLRLMAIRWVGLARQREAINGT